MLTRLYCVQVVEVLSDALTLPETPPAVKIARLMVVSDLLHNTGGVSFRPPATACICSCMLCLFGVFRACQSPGPLLSAVDRVT